MWWSAEFYPPIQLPEGGELQTLQDACDFIVRLRGSETNTLEWQVAIAAVLVVGKKGRPIEVARRAIERALYPVGTSGAVLQRRASNRPII